MISITPWLDVVLAIYRYRYQMHTCYQTCIILKLELSYANHTLGHTKQSIPTMRKRYLDRILGA